MQITHIEIHAGDVDRPYRTIGAISAKVQAATAFSQTPTIEDVNLKLQEQASRMGANAVIQVQYDRGMSLNFVQGSQGERDRRCLRIRRCKVSVLCRTD